MTWIFMISALVIFWLSLRGQENNLEYTLLALGLIGVAWVTNFHLRKYEKKEKD